MKATRTFFAEYISRSPNAPIELPDVSRYDLPEILRASGRRRGAEIGVWQGGFAERFLQADLELLAVDPWTAHRGWLDTKNELPLPEAEALIEKAYGIAVARLKPYPRCTIHRARSLDAVATVPDGSLDFVYIDADHSYAECFSDLRAWSRKVRRGGLIAGHDYRTFDNKPTIHVVEAVNDFTKHSGIGPFFVLAADRTPSFAWVNP